MDVPEFGDWWATTAPRTMANEKGEACVKRSGIATTSVSVIVFIFAAFSPAHAGDARGTTSSPTTTTKDPGIKPSPVEPLSPFSYSGDYQPPRIDPLRMPQ